MGDKYVSDIMVKNSQLFYVNSYGARYYLGSG